MITINDIKDKSADLYCSAGVLIGKVDTVLQMNDVCIQIKKMKLVTEYSGYYFICEGRKVNILSTGRIPNQDIFGIDFFNTELKQLEEILFN